jgi:hypothetical protein
MFKRILCGLLLLAACSTVAPHHSVAHADSTQPGARERWAECMKNGLADYAKKQKAQDYKEAFACITKLRHDVNDVRQEMFELESAGSIPIEVMLQYLDDVNWLNNEVKHADDLVIKSDKIRDLTASILGAAQKALADFFGRVQFW